MYNNSIQITCEINHLQANDMFEKTWGNIQKALQFD